MGYQVRTRDQHLSRDGKPKRMLALDGGGLRGILTLGMLKKIEDILRQRHGNDPDFRLSHYFDLIAGTSTGAIIAATLAKGWAVDDITKKYEALGHKVFEKSLLRKGLIRALYDETKLSEELRDVYGADTCLGSDALSTGLLVMTKRLDSGSPWPISNNPNGQFYNAQDDGSIGNKDYPLWKVVRASTAAPAFFDPESMTIADVPGKQPVQGSFVDGGVSPFNNPALQAFMYATLDGYRLNWPAGEDNMLLVSLGTGAADPQVTKSWVTAQHAVKALMSLMEDCAAMQETVLQWLSSSPTARQVDSEIGDLSNDTLGGTPQFAYLRYNVDLRAEAVRALDASLQDENKIAALSAMDAPENMATLHRLGMLAAAQQIQSLDFPSRFDLA